MKSVGELLGHIDENLIKISKDSKPSSDSSTSPKKRKAGALDENGHIPKKKNARSHDRSDTPTLSQREEKAMNNLMKQIEDCGGKF